MINKYTFYIKAEFTLDADNEQEAIKDLQELIALGYIRVKDMDDYVIEDVIESS